MKKSYVFVVLFIVAFMAVTICAFDYFGDGCEVSYNYTVTTNVNGHLITQRGTECHQLLIHTKRGAEMEKKYPGY